ncbi:MAG: cupin domain-containing protein [Candidatus Hydrogenedentes bacterium]|nr:cupin domain-containing protein [Candidatus Hydrogenedentota bacterium]
MYTLVGNLVNEIAVQEGSIVSKTVFQDDHLKAVLMALDAGQELSEHTASMPAVIHVLQGKSNVTLGGDVNLVSGGAWIHMPAEMKHAVSAVEPTVLLLLLLKSAKPR